MATKKRPERPSPWARSPVSTNVASRPAWRSTAGWLALGLIGVTLCARDWLAESHLAAQFLSDATWQTLALLLSGEIQRFTNETGVRVMFVIPVSTLLPWCAAFVALLWLGGGALLRQDAELRSPETAPGMGGEPLGRSDRLYLWGCKLGQSLSILLVWQLVWTIGLLVGWQGLQGAAEACASLTFAGVMALALWSWRSLQPAGAWSWLDYRTLVVLAGLHGLMFFYLNWCLWANLLIPHGDSAMYEEHLWNVLHGKGFRSYLDQGLFLGEHIQVVHLGLLPLYYFWPSHLLLELCESLALAAGSLVVYQLVRTFKGSTEAAFWLGVAYLLYFPMQFLDIEIDLKTFRPEAFGIPLLLLTFWRMELWRKGEGSLTSFLLAVAATYTVKEDYALVFGPLGLWIVVSECFHISDSVGKDGQSIEGAVAHDLLPNENKHRVRNFLADRGRLLRTPRALTGWLLLAFSVVYLLLAVKVVIPWFRGGEGVHYARYYAEFGGSFGEIAWNMATHPDRVLARLINLSTALFALTLLLPCGFLSLASPSRLAVGIPLFCLLSLNNIAQDPRHHFHAPLVAIVFWSAAAGVLSLGGFVASCRNKLILKWPYLDQFTTFQARNWIPEVLAFFAAAAALQTGIWFSLSPLGVTFWDQGSAWSWSKLYVKDPRAFAFSRIEALIPKSERVASTDYIHPRFTHHERSYDYSKYPRKVSGYELRVPDDTGWIVIDTQHPYSEIKHPSQVPEYVANPEKWEVFEDGTKGYFIVMRRRPESSGSNPPRLPVDAPPERPSESDVERAPL
ncbi:MAG: hypothetical protein C0478_00245 [Planctomyces sp.]|nr:hypothetical protein [Planctomyces sp.]